MKFRPFLLILALLLQPAAVFGGGTKLPDVGPPGAPGVNTSVEQLFEDMKKSFRADKAKGVHIRYQFHFTEPQGGDRWIVVSDGACTMGRGTIEHPDVTFSCSGADWLELSNGSLSGFRAFVTGRLRVKGSQSLARKLDELFP